MPPPKMDVTVVGVVFALSASQMKNHSFISSKQTKNKLKKK